MAKEQRRKIDYSKFDVISDPTESDILRFWNVYRHHSPIGREEIFKEEKLWPWYQWQNFTIMADRYPQKKVRREIMACNYTGEYDASPDMVFSGYIVSEGKDKPLKFMHWSVKPWEYFPRCWDYHWQVYGFENAFVPDPELLKSEVHQLVAYLALEFEPNQYKANAFIGKKLDKEQMFKEFGFHPAERNGGSYFHHGYSFYFFENKGVSLNRGRKREKFYTWPQIADALTELLGSTMKKQQKLW